MDQQLERKIAAVIRPTYTMAQEAQLDAVQRHLEELTAALRNANEQELPEEEYRHAEQAKRIELNQLLEQFALANKDNDESTATPFKKESSSNPTIKNSGNSDHYGKYTKNHPVRGNNSGFDKYQHNHHHSNPSSDSWASTRKEEKIEESDAYTSFFSNRRRQPRDGE